MLALFPGGCLLHHKGIEMIRQYLETWRLQWVNDRILIHSIFCTKRDDIAVTQF